MPWKATVQAAKRDRRQGKAPTTQAGEFVKEEIEHVRRGKHGARSPEQASAIGLSKARRAGVKLGPPPAGTALAKKKQGDGKTSHAKHSAKRSRARTAALKREGKSATSKSALSRHSRKVASRRSASSRSSSARKAARTRKHESA